VAVERKTSAWVGACPSVMLADSQIPSLIAYPFRSAARKTPVT
jgi:hypothetical protein